MMQTTQDKRQAKNRTKSRAMLRKVKLRTQWAPLLARDISTPPQGKRKGR